MLPPMLSSLPRCWQVDVRSTGGFFILTRTHRQAILHLKNNKKNGEQRSHKRSSLCQVLLMACHECDLTHKHQVLPRVRIWVCVLRNRKMEPVFSSLRPLRTGLSRRGLLTGLSGHTLQGGKDLTEQERLPFAFPNRTAKDMPFYFFHLTPNPSVQILNLSRRKTQGILILGLTEHK
jgi:hypothetical protein